MFVKATNRALIFHSLSCCSLKYQLHSYMHLSKIQTCKKQSNTEIKSIAVSVRGGPSFHYITTLKKNVVAHLSTVFVKRYHCFVFFFGFVSLYPLKGRLHSNMKILSCFTVIWNQYKNTKEGIWRMLGPKLHWTPMNFIVKKKKIYVFIVHCIWNNMEI